MVPNDESSDTQLSAPPTRPASPVSTAGSEARVDRCRLDQLPGTIFQGTNTQDLTGKAEDLTKQLLEAYKNINTQDLSWHLKQRLFGTIFYDRSTIDFANHDSIQQKAEAILQEMLATSKTTNEIQQNTEKYNNVLTFIKMRLIMDMTAALETSEQNELQEEQIHSQKKHLLNQAKFIALETSLPEFGRIKDEKSKDKENAKNTIPLNHGVVVKKDQDGKLFCETESLTHESILEMIHTLKLSGATTITWHGVQTLNQRHMIEQLCTQHGVTAKYEGGPRPTDLSQIKPKDPEDSNNLRTWLANIETLDNKPKWMSHKTVAFDNFMVGIIGKLRLDELLDAVHNAQDNAKR